MNLFVFDVGETSIFWDLVSEPAWFKDAPTELKEHAEFTYGMPEIQVKLLPRTSLNFLLHTVIQTHTCMYVYIYIYLYIYIYIYIYNDWGACLAHKTFDCQTVTSSE